MAQYDEGVVFTSYPSGEDFRQTAGAMTDKKYLALKLNATGRVTLNTRADVPVGFLAMDSEGDVPTQVSVIIDAYKHWAIASEAIAVGDLVNTEYNGQLGKAANPSGGGTQFIYGRAVTAAAAAGDTFLVQPIRSGGWA